MPALVLPDPVTDDLVARVGAVHQVSRCDVVALSPDQRAGRLATLRTSIDALEVAFTRTVAASDAAGDGQLLHGAGSTAAWLRHQLRMAPGEAGERVGLVTYDQFRAIGQATKELTDESAPRAAALLTDLAAVVDTARLRAPARYLTQVANPERGAVAFERQVSERQATFVPLPDGTWRLEALAEAEGAAILEAALTGRMAPADAGDRRTTAQRRYDAIVAPARTALDAGTAGLVGACGPTCWSPAPRTRWPRPGPTIWRALPPPRRVSTTAPRSPRGRWAGSPATPRSPASSSTPPAACSTSAGPNGSSHPPNGSLIGPATAAAGGRGVAPGGGTSTTSSPGPRAAGLTTPTA